MIKIEFKDGPDYWGRVSLIQDRPDELIVYFEGGHWIRYTNEEAEIVRNHPKVNQLINET